MIRSFFSQPFLQSSFERLGRTCDFFFKYPGVFFQAWAARGSMHSYFRTWAGGGALSVHGGPGWLS